MKSVEFIEPDTLEHSLVLKTLEADDSQVLGFVSALSENRDPNLRRGVYVYEKNDSGERMALLPSLREAVDWINRDHSLAA